MVDKQFHLATGEASPPKEEEKPKFHPVLGWADRGENG